MLAVLVVVDDVARVELVARALVVAVVLLVLFAVEDVVVALANVELVVAAPVELVELTGLTTTTPAMPIPPASP